MSMEHTGLRIDAELMRGLKAEAKRQRLSPSRLAGEAIEVMLHNCAEKRAAIRVAIKEADAGSFVSEEAMNEWVSSWRSDSETPAPEPDVFLQGDR